MKEIKPLNAEKGMEEVGDGPNFGVFSDQNIESSPAILVSFSVRNKTEAN